MRVKICGINSAAAFDAAANADYVGFVFFDGSPRNVSAGQAAAISGRASGGPRRVGLFVAPDLDLIASVLQQVALDALQIHNLAQVSEFRQFGLPVWRAVGVSAVSDLPSDLGGADELVLDAKAPAGASRPGGNAVRFDWQILAGWKAPGPWWLAGGLSPENVTAAIHCSGAQAVDVSSGVESAPGVKDPARIKAFIANARASFLGSR